MDECVLISGVDLYHYFNVFLIQGCLDFRGWIRGISGVDLYYKPPLKCP